MRYFWPLIALTAYLSLGYASPPPMCQGGNALLAIADRPSIAFSACPVPAKSVYLESGYASALLSGGSLGQQFPQSEFRYGLSDNTEINWFPPNYFTQRRPAQYGTSQNAFAVKQVFDSSDSHTFTGQAILGMPTGSQAFGSRRYGITLNSIYTHSLPYDASITGIIGFSTNTTPPIEGNTQYYSLNPIVLISPPPLFMSALRPILNFMAKVKSALKKTGE